jgi:hypothetical protein
MDKIPKSPLEALTEKRIQIIICSVLLGSALIWGIFKSKHTLEIKKNNIIKFSNYNTDILLEEQNSYHNDIKNRMEINNSNFQIEIESQIKTNNILEKQLQSLENRPPAITIIKDKRENKNEKTDALNSPSSY